MLGSFMSATQFYIYGKRSFTKTGYEKAKAKYAQPDFLEDPTLSLAEKVFVITGANSGIGYEISLFLASKNATVYMVCRNAQRGTEAKDKIVEKTANPNVFLLLCDCSLEQDVRNMWEDFTRHRASSLQCTRENIKLDCVVCNAGALLNERSITAEGVEVTFASHFLFGTFLLVESAMPWLEATLNSRVVVVSSGGMYCTKFPAWDVAASVGKFKYDGQLSYAYAKRGQVLLCEDWSKKHPTVKFVSCHPGWTGTEAVNAAYGAKKQYLEPMRTPWEGAEGIIWLCLAPAANLEGGAFYLDRTPRVKHISGPFFSEGSYTKNSQDEIEEMLQKLNQWSSFRSRPSGEELARQYVQAQPLAPIKSSVDIERFIGKWYVIANIPSFLEVGACNCIENYEWDSSRNCIQINFQYHSKGSTTQSSSFMRGYIQNAPFNSHWAIDVKVGVYLPFHISYLIIDLADDYSYTTIGVPNRSHLWIMIREKPIYTDENGVEILNGASEEAAEKQKHVLECAIQNAEELGYDRNLIVKVPFVQTLDL